MERPFVIKLWETIKGLMREEECMLELDKLEHKLFGFFKNRQDKMWNHIIMITKYYIHLCRLEQVKPLPNRLLAIIKDTEKVEEQISLKKGKINKHKEKWGNFTNRWFKQ